MNKEELQEILEKHQKWLNDEEGGERANLSGANLRRSNLSGADLSRANLRRANLSYANLDENQLVRRGLYLKEPLIGYKKCRDDLIVTLEIPKGAIVFSINNKKCRTNVAKVIEISNGSEIAYSQQDETFAYKVGETVYPKSAITYINVERLCVIEGRR